MKIMVLDGNENQAVACVRSLSQAGHEVYVGSLHPLVKSGLVAFLAWTVSVHSSGDGGRGYVRDIVREIRSLGHFLRTALDGAGTTLYFQSGAKKF